MKRKRIRYIYRYLTTPHRLHRWFNVQNLIILLIAAAFFVALAWPNLPLSATGETQQTVEVTPTIMPGPTRAATLSPEYLANSEQTVSITLVGAVLVLIVVVGVLVYMPRGEGV